MVIKTDGSLWAWGFNRHGQLGDGTNISTNTPIKVMDGVSAVSTGINISVLPPVIIETTMPVIDDPPTDDSIPPSNEEPPVSNYSEQTADIIPQPNEADINNSPAKAGANFNLYIWGSAGVIAMVLIAWGILRFLKKAAR